MKEPEQTGHGIKSPIKKTSKEITEKYIQEILSQAIKRAIKKKSEVLDNKDLKQLEDKLSKLSDQERLKQFKGSADKITKDILKGHTEDEVLIEKISTDLAKNFKKSLLQQVFEWIKTPINAGTIIAVITAAVIIITSIDVTDPEGSISIDGGEVFSSSAQVTLLLTYDDSGSGVDMVRFSNDGLWDAEQWEPPVTSKSWTLPGGDGPKTVYYQVRDRAGLVSPTYSDSITLDTTDPTGDININNMDIYTLSREVTLTLSYHDGGSGVELVRYSNDGVWDTESWEEPVSSRQWILESNDGTKIVYYQVRDWAGLVLPTYSDSIILDTTDPKGDININNMDTYTLSREVTLTLSYHDGGSGVDRVRYSNDGVWDAEQWEPPVTSKSWTLPGGDGPKTVYYQVRDRAGRTSNTFSDDIFLDRTNPTGSILVDNGASTTYLSEVILSLTFNDFGSGVDRVRYSNDGTWDTEPWLLPVKSRSWTLPPGYGPKTIYYQVRDKAGRISSTYSDSIYADVIG
jgi:histone H3/H4